MKGLLSSLRLRASLRCQVVSWSLTKAYPGSGRFDTFMWRDIYLSTQHEQRRTNQFLISAGSGRLIPEWIISRWPVLLKGIMVKVSSLYPDINTDSKEGISLTPPTSTRRQDISSLFPPSWWALIQEGSVGCWPARNYQFIWWADHHQSDTVSSTITEHSIHTMRRR